MKRFVVSTLVSACGLLLATTAHASFVEKHFVNDPDWKTQEEVDADQEERMDARTTNRTKEEDTTTDEPREFNETDDGGEARFGSQIRLDELNLTGNASITRAEFTALLVRSLYDDASIQWCYWDITSVHPPRFELLFRDVSVDHPQAPEICIAMRDGLVRGYGNDIFRPDAQITFADAAKIVARSHGLTPWADPSKPKHWFDTYIQALARRNAIPSTITAIEERITVSEAREILERLAENDRDRPSRTAEELIAAWERKYERPVVVPTRVATRPASMPSTGASSSVKAMIESKSSVMKPSMPASAGTASSRPKAWYEF